MKKLLLITFLSVSFTGLWAQSAYIPFPSDMLIYGTTITQSPLGTEYHSYRTEITGDTIIGGTHYEKLYSGLNPFIITAGIRNDTVNKKVFLYSCSSGTEKLLYDFDLNVGDTVNRYDGYGFYQPLVAGAVPAGVWATIDTAWVTSIDSVLMPHDGIYHRRFNFSGTIKNIDPDSADLVISSSSDGPYSYWTGFSMNIAMEPLVEGVGQIQNPVKSFGTFEYVWDYGLNCASINGATVVSPGSVFPPFIDPSLCNSLSVNVNEIKKSDSFVLYPNPTEGLLQIKADQQINSFEISDVFGKQVYHSEKVGQTEIDISKFANGIYFVRLTDSKGNSVNKKIIKQ